MTGDLPLMRRVSIVMFLVGGATCLSGVWITQQSADGRLVQAAIAGLLAVTGLGLFGMRTPRRRVMEASVIWSIFLLSGLVALADPVGMAPFFFLWPVVYVAYFSSMRMTAAAFASMALTLAAALVVNPSIDLKVDTFVGTCTSVGIMGALVATMTRQQAALRQELAVAAETDPLTGLLNRRSFNPLLERLVATSATRPRPVAVVMFDLDHFKRLNDDLGHLAGDRALQTVASILREHSREDDLVSRFGGEEFAVALAGADRDAARRYAERVADALCSWEVADGRTLSTSAGICSGGDQELSAEALLLRADDALYAAKEAGRCRAAWWDGGEVVVGEPFEDGIAV